MAPSFFARLLRSNENNEKTHSAVATSISPRPVSTTEPKKSSIEATESHILAISGADEPKHLSGLRQLDSPASSGRRTPSTQDELSTDPGDEDVARSVSLHSADFIPSDGESAEDTVRSRSSSPRSPSSPSSTPDSGCYSVQDLLRMRTSVCADSTLKYSTCPREEPAKESKTPASKNSASKDTKVIERPAMPELPATGENSWAANMCKRKAPTTTADEDKAVERSARSILNKLTIEKFDSLFEKLTNCGIKASHHISMLMSEIFEKATTQHHFIPMYADCCARLEKDANITAVCEDAGHIYSFRRLLLNQCQSVFESLLESKDDADMDDEMKLRRKQRALGNMKLIGQLLVQGMLSSELFTECSAELIRRRGDCPEALEALAALMMVAAPKFDNQAFPHFQKLQSIFTSMKDLTADKTVAARLRFLLRDVLDARTGGWPGAVKTEPTTLDAVREKRDQEALKAFAPRSTGSPRLPVRVPLQLKPKTLADAKAAAPWAPKAKEAAAAAADVVVEAQLEAKAEAVEATLFDIKSFRKNLALIFNDLASDKNIPAAVQRVRSQQVPAEFQADQFVDIITRIVEERRGAVRRCELAFAAGLASAGDGSAFDREKCLDGIGLFFQDVYGDLCEEVQRLPAIMKSEFLPTMYSVFPVEELNKRVPPSMRK